MRRKSLVVRRLYHSPCTHPGTGKSLTAAEVCSRTGMRHVDVGLVAKQHNLYEGFDEQYQCPILDEDKVRNCRSSVSRVVCMVSMSLHVAGD